MHPHSGVPPPCKVRVLKAAMEHLVRATAGRCDELSADDLVPLVTLVLVACSPYVEQLDFEAFLLDDVLTEALTGGHEGYAVCTVQVAIGFLRHLQLQPAAALAGSEH